MLRSVKLSKRAARVGFDWPDSTPVLDKLNEEMLELSEELIAKEEGADNQAEIESELGDILFSYTSLARFLKVDPEQALRGTNDRFEARFRRIETMLAAKGEKPEDQSLDTLEALWQEAKAQIRQEHAINGGENDGRSSI